MPNIQSLLLYLPTREKLVETIYNNIRGPKDYVSLLKQSTPPGLMGERLLNTQNNPAYKALQSGLFWYRLFDASTVYSGVLCGLDADGFANNQITTHEHVLERRVAHFTHYLKRVKLQAEPLLVIHEDDRFALQFEKEITNRSADHAFRLGSERHEIWRLSELQSHEFMHFAKRQDQFHLADGHHRLASSIRHLNAQNNPLPIQCFLINKTNSKRKSFQWNIKKLPNPSSLYTQLEKVSSEAKNPEIIVATKDRIHRLACPKGLNPAQYCFEELLGFSLDVKQNIKEYIDHIPLETKEFISIKYAANHVATIAFRPLHWSEILSIAKQGNRLPPKSTYLLPKLPTGLFISPI